MLNQILNEDCVKGMSRFPDKFFDIAIVDPPYFDGPNTRGYYGSKVNRLNIKRKDYLEIDTWDIPGKEYFEELLRVSKNQIVWGCNYFNYYLGPGRIVWDKCNVESSFSDCEIAYCSMHDSIRKFEYMWNGMLQGKSMREGRTAQGNKKLTEKRIHPCQKPVILYDWLIAKYTKPGDIVLDTHVGSGSSLIACHKAGLSFVGFEINPVYWEAATERLNDFRSQISIKEFLEE